MAQSLTPEIVQAAIDGLTAKQEAIGRQLAELRSMLPGSITAGNTSSTAETGQPKKRGRKRVLSPEARERIAAAQRARWAAARGEKSQASAPAKPARKKRKLSPEGRRAIVAALKKRWAAKRAGIAKAAPAKKAAKRRPAKKSAQKKTASATSVLVE